MGEEKRKLYRRDEDPRDSHSLHLFFIASLLMYAGVAFKNFFKSSEAKQTWSIIVVIVYAVGMAIFVIRLIKGERTPRKKAIDLAICAVMLFLVSDMIFEYSFLNMLRPWFGDPVIIGLFGVFFMFYYRTYPDFEAGREAAEESAKARQEFLKEEARKRKSKNEKTEYEE